MLQAISWNSTVREVPQVIKKVISKLDWKIGVCFAAAIVALVWGAAVLIKRRSYQTAGLDISRETRAKIQGLMPHIIAGHEVNGLNWILPKHSFSLNDDPGIIFKTEPSLPPFDENKYPNTNNVPAEEYARMQEVRKDTHDRSRSIHNQITAKQFALVQTGQKVIRENNLNLLVLPTAAKFNVDHAGETYTFMALKPPCEPSNFAVQEELYRQYATSMKETFRQLVIFIAKVGCSVVSSLGRSHNMPVLDAAPEHLGSRRIGLLNIYRAGFSIDPARVGLYGEFGSDGILSHLFFQSQIEEVVNQATQLGIAPDLDAKAARLTQLESEKQLQSHYQNLGVLQYPRKPISFGAVQQSPKLTLNLKATHPDLPTHMTMEHALNVMINTLNTRILQARDEGSLMRKRHFALDFIEAELNPFKECRTAAGKLWLEEILQALVDTGQIFSFKHHSRTFYQIQA